MSSRAQKQANRANARQSTGPKTLNGKGKSSLNALKHGLSSEKSELIFRDEKLYKLLILNGFSSLEEDRVELAFSRLKMAMAAMADAYLHVDKKDSTTLEGLRKCLADVSIGDLITAKARNEYFRLRREIAKELADPLNIGKRVERAYPTIRYQQSAAAELSKTLKSAKTNPI